jgi:hypothetical protein
MFCDLNKIYVDAGCFVVGDRNWFISKGADPKSMEGMEHQFVVKCGTGKRMVHYILPHSWDGYRTDAKILDVKSGELWITDACYVIRDDLWDKFLDEKYLDRDDESHFTIHTGGDGEFDLELVIE